MSRQQVPGMSAEQAKLKRRPGEGRQLHHGGPRAG